MGKKLRLECHRLSDEKIQEIIQSHVALGWEFDGILEGFPPNTRWIHLSWSKDSPPIQPGKESSS